MPSLLAATLLWALSFGLIKGRLVGLDSNFVGAARLLLALPLFLPLLRVRGLGRATALRLLMIGAVQYGVMYVGYIAAFRFAAAHQIALYTVLTPLYVALVHDAYARRFDPRTLGLAALAVAGAAVIQAGEDPGLALAGFALLQVSNLCFAWGQVAYRRLRRERPGLRDRDVFALQLLGGLAVTAAATAATGGWASAREVTAAQAWTLAYLGVLATGVGFFLWNRGAVQVGASALGGGLMVVAAVLAARRGEA